MKFKTTLANITLNNPIISVPGPIASYHTSKLDVNTFGAVVVRSSEKYLEGKKIIDITDDAVTKTKYGLINQIALEHDGIKDMNNELSYLKDSTPKIIANVYGSTHYEYIKICNILNENSDIDFLEINISCPNIKGGIAFGIDAKATYELIKEIKREVSKPIIVKLSPNVSNISEMALGAEAGGADVLSMINTVFGTTINTKTRKPSLSSGFGGYSGPGIMPMALYAVLSSYKAVKIPIIGIGGITNSDDALQFFMAGASAIGIGSILNSNLNASVEILEGINNYMDLYGFKNIKELIGIANK